MHEHQRRRRPLPRLRRPPEILPGDVPALLAERNPPCHKEEEEEIVLAFAFGVSG
jgi:hypothetical protein